MPALDALAEQSSHASDAHGTGGGRGLGLGIRAGFGNEHLSLGPVKVFMDGSLLGATAAVTEDYCGHQHNTGYLLDTPEQYLERVSSAYRSGWPVALHAIGDAAIDLAIEIISGLQERHGLNALPNRIEHFGIARPDQVAAVARHGIAVTPQASFIGPLGDQFAQLVGPEREGWLYRGASLLRGRRPGRGQLRPAGGRQQRPPRHGLGRRSPHRKGARARRGGRMPLAA